MIRAAAWCRSLGLGEALASPISAATRDGGCFDEFCGCGRCASLLAAASHFGDVVDFLKGQDSVPDDEAEDE